MPTHDTGSLNDFALQFDQKNGIDLEAFTLVLFDLPGFGLSQHEGDHADQEHHHHNEKSRDNPTMEYFENCANIGASLMAHLQFKTYSVAAWSDGARVASLLAVEQPSRVNSLLLWSFLPTIQPSSSWALARTRDISTWDQSALKFYTDVYGEHEFSEKWRKYVDWLVSATDESHHFDIRPILSKIKCPTLILHGAVDPIVDFREVVVPLERVIPDSNIEQLRGLSHNLHQADSCRFNQVLTSFVLNTGLCH